ncbi:MAG: GNAT family N-acetyltransferase [Clostridia bacterium]|nr:GNAT family N-acetyltransferase [Clostridia bacterium]
MQFLKATGFLQYFKIKRLYKQSFPQNERKPFSIIKSMQKKGKTDIWYFTEKNQFIGFATTINGSKTILIDYFAVCKDTRGKGFGTKMLKTLLEYYDTKGVFLEIEIPYTTALNYDERLKRKKFYLNAGLSPMGTQAKLFGVDMELLGFNCELTFDQYREFYLNNYGKFAYDNIKRID